MRITRRKKLSQFNELVVGARGFEPRTSCAQGRRATRLRYAPTVQCVIHSKVLSKFRVTAKAIFFPRKFVAPAIDLIASTSN